MTLEELEMSIDHNHPDYIDLRWRIRENPKDFVVIAGAGLSKPGGLPSWLEMRDYLVQDALDRISEIPEAEQDGYVKQLERILEKPDLWTCFTELRHILSRQAYEQCIKRNIIIKDKKNIPQTYDLLWKLNIKGLLTYNIDSCAADSYARTSQCAVDTATGKEVARFSQFLSGSQQFVFQPHGNVQDPSTWVFTNSERAELLNNTAYTKFMTSLCQTKQLLILGFNPDDFAFSYLVQNALTGSTTGSKHFILLPKSDPGQIKGYSEQGFAVIPYDPIDSKTHPEIEETLRDFLEFLPYDEIPASVFIGNPGNISELPNDDELIRLPIDKMRVLLNGAIASIIPPDKQPNPADIDKLEEFYRDHLRAIHMAWLIEPKSDCDTIHGYKAIESKGRGAFGHVYEVENITTKERAAIKVLLPEVRHNPDYLNSFRRGVRSMRILTQRNVEKMVKIIDAFEVPACVLMELIDGPTLTQAKERGLLNSLPECLDVIVQIGEVVHHAHNLEERVLHRDLKPDNVILRNAYSTHDPLDVVVLDFDLSWHKGASDLSVVHGARAQGYAAPEQTATGMQPGITTRHTAVDVFGYGMLTYFILVGNDPRPNEHNFERFKDRIKEVIQSKFKCKWHCLPVYLADTIENCTCDDQTDRMPFASAVEYFRAAHSMTLTDNIAASNPLILQEMAVLLDPLCKIETMDFGRKVEIICGDPSKQICLCLINDSNNMIVRITLSKVRKEGENRSISKYLESAKNKALSKLNVSTFKNISGTIGLSNLIINADWPLKSEVSRVEIEDICSKLIDARFSMELS
jgi:eukaryotic-like serine/threonine-protein kinase